MQGGERLSVLPRSRVSSFNLIEGEEMPLEETGDKLKAPSIAPGRLSQSHYRLSKAGDLYTPDTDGLDRRASNASDFDHSAFDTKEYEHDHPSRYIIYIYIYI